MTWVRRAYNVTGDPRHVTVGGANLGGLAAISGHPDAGTMELDLTGRGSSIPMSNRHLRDVLRAKGYEVFYQEF